MWGWFGGMGWGGWVVMAVCMVLFWGAVAYVVAALLRPGRPTAWPGPAEDPVRLLEERLARGDISVEEFTARRDALTHPGHPPRPPVEHFKEGNPT